MNPFGISDQSYQLLQQYFAKNINIAKVIIFGSRALGTYRNGSDIDFAIFGSELDDIQIKAGLEELQTPYMYDIINYQKLDKPELKQHINTHGIVFYERQN